MLDINNYINNEIIDEYMYFSKNEAQHDIVKEKYNIFNVPSIFKPKIIEGHKGGIKSFFKKLKSHMKFKKKKGGVCDSKSHPNKNAVKSLKSSAKKVLTKHQNTGPTNLNKVEKLYDKWSDFNKDYHIALLNSEKKYYDMFDEDTVYTKLLKDRNNDIIDHKISTSISTHHKKNTPSLSAHHHSTSSNPHGTDSLFKSVDQDLDINKGLNFDMQKIQDMKENEQQLNDELRKTVEAKKIEIRVNNRIGEIENDEYTNSIRIYSFLMNLVLIIVSLIIVYILYSKGTKTSKIIGVIIGLFGVIFIINYFEYNYTF